MWSESPWSGWWLTERHNMLLGTVGAQAFVFPNLLYEEGAKIECSMHFSNSRKGISQSDLYQFWRQASAIRKSCSPTVICLGRQQAQGAWKAQTSCSECGSCWAWLRSFTAWFSSCCWLLYLHVVYGIKMLVVLLCAFKLQQYLPFNFGTGCFVFISGCTDLQCNLFTAEATLTQFESWETEVADSSQKTWTTILHILFTKPFYFMHPVLHGRVIRRKLRECSIN